MNTLWTFGCSYTDGYGKIPEKKTKSLSLYERYYFYKGYFPKIWNEVLAEKLNFNLENKGKQATGFEYSFEQLCIVSDDIQKNDIVIFQVPFIERYRIPSHENNWNNISSDYDGKLQPKLFSEMRAVQRTHNLYKQEVFNYLNLINNFSKLKKFDFYVWFADGIFYDYVDTNDDMYLLNGNCFLKVFENGGLKINEETNNKINDLHFGELAHKIMGNMFYEHITKK